MRVLAINGSPHGKAGNTDLILQNLLLGMQQAGNTTETIYLDKLNIRPCIGCFSCWFKTPGECIHHDDMQQLLPKLIAADLTIYATPLYIYSMTGLLKNFLDRTIPMALPFLIANENVTDSTKHPKRYETNKIQKTFLVASAGFPELMHFEPLVHTFKYVAEAHGLKYLGEILKPAAGLLKAPKMQDKVAVYGKNLQIAGKQLAEQEMISKELLTKLHEPWMTAQEYRDNTNRAFQEKLKK